MHIRDNYPSLRPKRQYIPQQNVTLGLHTRYPESGPWGPWSTSSACSRTCGGGVAFQTRICLDTRSDGRNTCIGPSKKYFSCNIQDCVPGTPDFRAEQCARFNSQPFENHYYNWIPYTRAPNPCELNCMPKNERFYYRQARKVVDGTKCYDDGSLDICVDGVCTPVGCDKQLGSNLKEDICRVCGGDNSTCRVVKGVFDSNNLHIGYNDIILIPVGAVNIKVEEVQPTNNYLAVRNLNGDYYLNGNWRIELPRELKFAGTVFLYSRKPHGYVSPEMLRSLGPTTEPIFISLLSQERNLGIRYEYAVPISAPQPPSQESYSWMFGDYGRCSRTCGGGQQRRAVYCARSLDRQRVPEYLCDPRARPEDIRVCNTNLCPPDWSVGEWSECRCPGVRYRVVFCQKSAENGRDFIVAPADECKKQRERPEFLVLCEIRNCPPLPTVPHTMDADKKTTSIDPKKTTLTTGTDSSATGTETTKTDSARTDTSGTDTSGTDTSGTGTSRTDTTGTDTSGTGTTGTDTSGTGTTGTETSGTGTTGTDTPGTGTTDTETSRTDTTGTDTSGTGKTGTDTSGTGTTGTDGSKTDTSGTTMKGTTAGTKETTATDTTSDGTERKSTTGKTTGDTQTTATDASTESSMVEVCTMVSKTAWKEDEWSECDARCGEGTKKRNVYCYDTEQNKTVNENLCDLMTRPNDTQECDEIPCEGVDWITSAWSDCDSKCGSSIQTRSVLCSTEEGKVYPDRLCQANRRPNDTQVCEKYAGCDAIWFTSEWSNCSVQCGKGMKTRFVFCGRWDDDQILTANDSECSSTPKPLSATECENEPCEALWHAGPWEACPLSCSENKERSRRAICIHLGDAECDETSQPPTMEPCLVESTASDLMGNETSCDLDADEFMKTDSCSKSTHGCCPDGVTPRKQNYENCPPIDAPDGCEATEFGCCGDNKTAAFGPFKKGCPVDCNVTRYGCCEDGKTPANGTDFAGCGCETSKYGCCPDGETKVKGENNEGCEFVKVEPCEKSKYGCCKDKETQAKGPNMEGCDSGVDAPADELSGDDCIIDGSGEGSTVGLCREKGTEAITTELVTAAPDCSNTTFGCCLDGITAAQGENYKGCEDQQTTAKQLCNETEFGCCPDNITAAKGSDLEGCIEMTRSTMTDLTMMTDLTSTDGNFTETELSETESTGTGTTGTESTGTGSTGTESTGTGTTGTEAIGTEITEANATDTTGLDLTDTTEANATLTSQMTDMTETTGMTESNATETAGSTIGYETTEVDCAQSKFGCCADNTSTATGPNGEGCPCHLLPFGCCPDRKTPAKGERYYGCTCHEYPYGCCQDNYTPARGPDFDGCLCDRMLYGCCPDGITPRVGNDPDACNCERTVHRCCPDGKTPAKGPNYQGCPCEIMPFGCCADRKTPARGPESEGCPCNTLPHGCCPDGTTPAKGPRYQGCECVKTPFGCCPDGVSVAFGPKFEGCPDGPDLDTKLSAEACSLPKERGSCRNYVVKWYFDANYGGCTRFWYGGCEGNGNQFQSQEECEKVCVSPQGTLACLLPKVRGPCEGNTIYWYYDSQSKQCGQFYYGGCLGNNNRFQTREACESLCVNPDLLDTCDQQPDHGPCRGTYTRWYYDKRDSQCKQFVYGGCRGNKNNFESERECRDTCGSMTPQEICRLPKAEGKCLGSYPRWFYDYQTGTCQEFTYSGCDGNRNRFVDKASCETLCNRIKKPTVSRPEDKCMLEKSEGGCGRNLLMWYFNKERRRCEQFYYGGCEGNSNRFESRNECEKTCLPPIREENVCLLEKEIGNCYNFQERWYFDAEERQCHRFYFSGCNGNGNNFASFEECEAKCGMRQKPTEMSPTDFKVEYCFMNADHGPCDRNEILWFYDKADGVCKQFYYGGCEGNQNRFPSRKECETRCWNSQKICKLPKVKGPCSGKFVQWFYNEASNECEEFQYGGCQGNANRFSSKEACENQCQQKKETSPEPSARVPEVNICLHRPDPGPCKSYLPHFYYSSADNSCRMFIYGGCKGNENRFHTRKECEDRCVIKSSEAEEKDPTDEREKEVICRQPVDAGSCNQTYPRWYYDPPSYTCLPFVYGGCGGTRNRFKSFENCMRLCQDVRPVEPTPETRPTPPRNQTLPAVCPASSCDDLRCPYGVDEYADEHGCKQCRCSNPCYSHQCPAEQRCALEAYRAPNGDPKVRPVCRLTNKPGECPKPTDEPDDRRECVDRCRDDADCRNSDKCCSNGCAMICLPAAGVPQAPSTTEKAKPPPPDEYDVLEIVARAGTDVVLDCGDSNYASKVSWSKDQQPIYFLGDYRVQLIENGSLLLKAVESDDIGTYACTVEDSRGSTTTKFRKLIVQAPAQILPGPTQVLAPVNTDAFLQCNAIGFPEPRVTWSKSGSMLPTDSIRYHQYKNYTLLVRRVGPDDGGIYTCQAHNGLGPAALLDVTLLIDYEQPEIRPYEPSSARLDERPPYEQSNYDLRRGNNENVRPLTPLTPTQPIEAVSVEAEIASPEYKTGSSVQMNCIVRGYPPPTVRWYLRGKAQPLSSDSRITIFPNNTLIIDKATPSDSGEYMCIATNDYNEASASIPLKVEDIYVPTECIDSPNFANCALVVKVQYCNNKHYARFCCRSCLLSGQLDRSSINEILS